MKRRSKILLAIYAVSTLALSGFAFRAFEQKERAFLLPGQTTHGHYEIELACNACHTPGNGVTQDACTDCHGKALEQADDSHPAAKFRDPRNADRLTKLNALACVTCHTEHQPEHTFAMGVTQPTDYCFHCHSDIKDERPSHANLTFDSCQNAGCHNFHDNRALSEDFLGKHLSEPEHLKKALVAVLPKPDKAPLARSEADAPADKNSHAAVLDEWADSGHARARINCMDCHAGTDPGQAFVDKPSIDVCQSCHAQQFSGFKAGKHGMRLAQDLPAMQPRDARLPMKPDAADRQLGCNSCHSSHEYDRAQASVNGCLSCHNDQHSRAYQGSPHYKSFQAEIAGQAEAGSGVSCATCHLPRVTHPDSGELLVQHNQNENLRPNEEMLRSVCSSCHGVEFALDALADRALIDRNFAGRPAVHVQSMDMVKTKLSGGTPTKETK